MTAPCAVIAALVLLVSLVVPSVASASSIGPVANALPDGFDDGLRWPIPPSSDGRSGAMALDNTGPAVGAGDRQPISIDMLAELPAANSAAAQHLKFAEGVQVSLVDGELVGGEGDVAAVAGVQQLLDSAGVSVAPLFGLPAEELDALRDRAAERSGNQQATLSLWFRLTRDGFYGIGMQQVLDRLNELDLVEVAYPEPVAAAATAVPLAAAPSPVGQASPDWVETQLYLQPAPVGLGVLATWNEPGGRGQNVTVYDIEQAWNTQHEDLTSTVGAEVPNGIPRTPPPNPAHGTAVAGVLWADENEFGVTGIAPDSQPGLVNVYTTGGIRLTNAILLAAQNLNAGDIALIEQQVCPGPLSGNSCPAGWLPIEYVGSYYDAIKTVADAGIIVVEAAGNGGRDVDAALVRPDSGAILVGAGNAEGCADFGIEPARGRLSFSNYGGRVHLQGHGGCVHTTGTLAGGTGPTVNSSYTTQFSGTSSGSAIVAGSAALLSSVALEHDIVLSPAEVRDLLAETGVAQDTTGLGGSIGPQPDVDAAVGALMDTLINPVPANDEYFLAHTLDATPSTRVQTTNGATVQSGEPVPACTAMGETVWFVIPPGPGAEVTISTAGSSFDTAMALWREVPGEAFLEQAGCNNDAELANGEIVDTSSITTTLEAGVLYRIQVGSAMGQTGDLVLSVVANGTCDVNADGFGDVLLGSPTGPVGALTNAGTVTVVLGGADEEQISQQALHQDTAGVFGRAEANDRFGGATACVDVDGDGVDDIVVGSPGEGIGSRSGAGAIHVLFGGVESFAERSIYLSQSSGRVPGSSETGDLFGATLASGDLNGDGLVDLVVGAPGEGLGRRDNAGAVTILYGREPGDTRSASQMIHQDSPGVRGRAEANDRFGAAIAVADFDGDGYDDLVVGAPGEAVGSVAGVGMVTILRGGEAGLTPADSILGIDNARDQLFGSSLAASDLDGDGVAELVIGAPGERESRSWAYVYSRDELGVLSLRGPAPGADVSTLTGSGFGVAVAVGDVDADGVDEVFVGAPAIGSVSYQIGSTVQEVLLVDVAGQLALTELPSAFGSELIVQDMTGDGRGDLVVRATDAAGEPILILLPGSPTGPELSGARLLGTGPRV